jgi:hypothetical protein
MLLIIIMSNSNTFNNNQNNFPQTSLNDAYRFQSFSTYINNNGLQTMFSPRCIFCSSNNSVSLINDGSFRQCRTCNKQFKALFTNNQIIK